MITAKRAKALRIIMTYNHVRSKRMAPTEFAKLMWPDSEKHHQHDKCGPRGTTKSSAIILSAGGFMGKMTRSKQLEHVGAGYNWGYRITQVGREALAEYEGTNN